MLGKKRLRSTRINFAWSLGIFAAFASVAQAQPQTALPVPLKLSALREADLTRQLEFFPSTQPEVIHSGGCGVMEGITSASDGRVFFTEITRSTGCNDARGVQGGRIWVIDPPGKPRLFREPSGMAAGLAIDAQDRMIVAEGADYGGRRVSSTDLKTGEYRVLAYFHGGCLNFCVRGAGRLVHGGGRRLRRTTDAVGKSVPHLKRQPS